jgi:hypothetical protein
MEANPPNVNFGPEGQPVFLMPEWSPGVEVVQGIPVEGAPVVTPMPEGGPGVRPVFVLPGTLPATAAAFAHQGAAGQQALAQLAAAAQATSSQAETEAHFLLLLA